MLKSTRDPRQSYVVNGKFQLPKLPPSCFGLAVHYSLTAEDIERGHAAYGDDFTENEEMGPQKLLAVGDIVECGQYTIRDKPRAARYIKVTKTVTRKQMDSCRITGSGKAGSQERIAALAEFYSEIPLENQLDSADEQSPFTCDLAKLVSKSAIAVENDFDAAE